LRNRKSIDVFFRKQEWCGINSRKRINCRLALTLLPGAKEYGSEIAQIGMMVYVED
jgi:hypothetical protein